METQQIGRRSNIEIIGDILRLGRTGKTNIMYGCDLSYVQLQKYLSFLLERGFIERDDQYKRKNYRPTHNGEQLLGRIDEVRSLLSMSDRDADVSSDLGRRRKDNQDNKGPKLSP